MSEEQLLAPMDMMICVGFGSAIARKDGTQVYDGELDIEERGEAKTVRDIEAIAKEDPDHCWRIIINGPMHGDTFQRRRDGQWVCIESNDGFA